MFERQVIFEKIGKEKQKLIESSKITIIGIGAIGTNTAESLVRCGVKELILIDNDKIEEHNLQRQVLFTKEDIGDFKVDVAEKKLKLINNVNIKFIKERLTKENIYLINSDLILDCTDNIETRFLINEFCKKERLPWIYCSAIESTGMVLVVTPKTPCFSCIIKEPTETLGSCEENGILNTIAKTISSIQVTEALKILTKQQPTKELIHFDIWKTKLIKTKVKKDPLCKVCQGSYENLESKTFSVKKCTSGGAFIARPLGKQELDLNKVKENFTIIADTPVVVIIKDKFKVSCYKNGKLMIESETLEEAEKQAERIYST